MWSDFEGRDMGMSFWKVTMTCDEESIKRQSHPKFYCSLDAWKQNSEASKKLHNSVRPLIIQEERSELAKNHRRYIEEEMKKFSEQQAKHRDAVPLIPQMSVMPPQQMHPTRFAPASGAGYNLISAHPMIASGRAMNPRKRTYEDGAVGWLQHPATVARGGNELSSSNLAGRSVPFSQPMSIMHNLQNKEIVGMSSQPESAIRNVRQQNVGLVINKASGAQVCQVPVVTCANSDAHCNGSAIADLGDSQMRNFMDQLKHGNTLNDLGDGCLDDLLNAPSDCIQQPSTSTTDKFNDKIESPAARTIPSVNSSSIVSPGSAAAQSIIDGPSSVSSSRINSNNPMTGERTESNASRKQTPDSGADYGNPVGVSLSSINPSSGPLSNCCLSQAPSTSVFLHNGIVNNNNAPAASTGAHLQMCSPSLSNQLNSYPSGGDPRFMQQPSSHTYRMMPQSVPGQPYLYPKDNNVGPLVRPQQRFMNPTEPKRPQIVNHEYHLASMSSQAPGSYGSQPKPQELARVTPVCNRRPVAPLHYQSAAVTSGEAPQMTSTQGQLFPDQYVMQPALNRPQQEMYQNYSMVSPREHQMAVYPVGAKISIPHQQQFPNSYMPSSQPYFPPSNVSYRYP
ncbi:unnamed protein product [Enterobius vermicularis]|uniref:Mastermind-like protein 2 n=1 Tax=Enterobius vermicularis TaxID=51028 RepID=A0A0N4VDV3_ENTVE|nr:unnamed protein product [Enterobius vermicularis]